MNWLWYGMVFMFNVLALSGGMSNLTENISRLCLNTQPIWGCWSFKRIHETCTKRNINTNTVTTISTPINLRGISQFLIHSAVARYKLEKTNNLNSYEELEKKSRILWRTRKRKFNPWTSSCWTWSKNTQIIISYEIINLIGTNFNSIKHAWFNIICLHFCELTFHISKLFIYNLNF